MYRITRRSTICVTIAAATVALILLTSATLTISVYAARHHHGNRSIEDGYQTYGLSGPPLSDQINAPPVSDQANGKEQIQTHAPTITYKSPWSNNLQASSSSNGQPLCAAGICSQSPTNH